MTTTMAVKRASLLALAGLALAPMARAQLQFKPTLELQETWSDNPTLAASGQTHSQLISRVSPGFTLDADSNRLQLHASYQMNLFQYSDRRLSGNDVVNHALALDGKARLVADQLFLDFHASVSQQPVSPFAPVNPDADYLSYNRGEIRTYSISPFWLQRLGSFAVLTLRYTRDSVSSDQGGLGDSSSDNAVIMLNNGSALRRWGWNAMLSRQNLDDNIGPPSSSSHANLGLQLRLFDNFSLLEDLGYDKFSYQNMQGEDTQGRAWSSGFKWEPSSRTSLRATAGRRYYGPSYSVAGSHRGRHTIWNINYGDSVTNSRQQFLLPSSVDTTALLNSMLLAQIPDAAERATAVAAFIRANGLPASLPNSINYFSNRYILQKQATATAALNGAHSTLLFSVYRMRRTALSLVTEDSALFGPQSANLYDNTDQRGASITASYRFNARTSSALSTSYGKTDSLSLQQVQVNRAWRWMISRQFQPRLSGILELRRSRNQLSVGAGSYTENAVAASLSMHF